MGSTTPPTDPPPYSPLRGRDEHYRFLIENCSDIVFSLDAEGLITFIGPQVHRYGHDPKKMIRTHFLDYILPSERKRVYSAFQRKPDQHHDSSVDFHFLDTDGNGIPMEEKGQAILGEDGSIQGLSGVLRDVTERRQAEEAMLRAERLMGLDYLAGGIAHQFNNIHASLVGYLDLLSMQEDLSASTRRFVDHIQHATDRAVEVTRNMAAFARLKRSPKGSVDLNQIVESTLALIREELKNEGILLTVELEEDLPPIQAHAGEMSQVLLNLLINAHHSLAECGRREIHLLTRKEDERQAEMEVRDTGCGISPRNINRIFMPFYSTKGEYSSPHSPQVDHHGTGLGLSICSSILREHGGEIHVESTLGKGTAFSVKIPFSRSPAETIPTAAAETPAGRNLTEKRILILDDDRSVRSIYAQTLRLEGYRVRTTANGFSALRWLKKDRYDLILLDLKMPLMDGVEVLDQLHRIPIADRPLIVVVSGLSPDVQPDLNAYDLAVPPLQKPLNIKELGSAIRRAFG